jgi:hypothetical protein
MRLERNPFDKANIRSRKIRRPKSSIPCPLPALPRRRELSIATIGIIGVKIGGF